MEFSLCRVKEGAAPTSKESVICEIVMSSGTRYKVRSFVRNAKLIEFNARLQSNLDLLVNRPEQEGYLAILMLPI